MLQAGRMSPHPGLSAPWAALVCLAGFVIPVATCTLQEITRKMAHNLRQWDIKWMTGSYTLRGMHDMMSHHLSMFRWNACPAVPLDGLESDREVGCSLFSLSSFSS